MVFDIHLEKWNLIVLFVNFLNLILKKLEGFYDRDANSRRGKKLSYK